MAGDRAEVVVYVAHDAGGRGSVSIVAFCRYVVVHFRALSPAVCDAARVRGRGDRRRVSAARGAWRRRPVGDRGAIAEALGWTPPEGAR